MVGGVKNIDIKSLTIGVLLTTTIIIGVAAAGNTGNRTVKLEGPIDLRLSFGSPRVSSLNTSTPTELKNRDTLTVNLNHKTDQMNIRGVGFK